MANIQLVEPIGRRIRNPAPDTFIYPSTHPSIHLFMHPLTPPTCHSTPIHPSHPILHHPSPIHPPTNPSPRTPEANSNRTGDCGEWNIQLRYRLLLPSKRRFLGHCGPNPTGQHRSASRGLPAWSARILLSHGKRYACGSLTGSSNVIFWWVVSESEGL